MKRTLITLSILILAVAAAIGLYQFNRGVASLSDAKADYEMTADELYSAFESDENEALKRFEGKIIATSGRVMEVKKSENGVNIVLEAEGAILGGVNCSFKEIDPLPKVGDSIRLKGRCQGYLMSVVLNNCSLVHE